MPHKPTFELQGTYFGGKGAAGVVHKIINEIPRHDVFISGFLGKCAVMRWKRPASLNIGIDIDPNIIYEWSSVSNDALHLECKDFLLYLTKYRYLKELYNKSTFLYLDPPYLPETRSSGHKYPFELAEWQHEKLLSEALKLPCMVALSCYDSDLYRDYLSTWRKINFRAQTRGGIRIETLYMNYPKPDPSQLHDPRFLGDNYRDRERGTRRISTIKSKITRLTPDEKARLSEWLHAQVSHHS